MQESSPYAGNGGPIPKTRDDDARGAPAGAGVILPEHGGRIGNPPHVPTEEQRRKVRALAQTMKAELPVSRRWIARNMGFSVATLDRHYADDMEQGRAEVVASLGAKLIGIAMGTTQVQSKEQLDAIKFALARIGGWSTKLEVTGQNGGPVQHATFDLSKLDEAGKRALLPVLDQLLESGEEDGSPSNSPA
jgi:hypothetical protein